MRDSNSHLFVNYDLGKPVLTAREAMREAHEAMRENREGKAGNTGEQTTEPNSLAHDAIHRPAPRTPIIDADGFELYRKHPEDDDLDKPGHATGPRTPSGKRISSTNGFMHGLTGQILFMTDAEHEVWLKHSKGYFERWQPVGSPEEILVQAIADDNFRMNQGRAFESALHALMLAEEHLPFFISDGLPDEAVNALGRARNWMKRGKDLSLITLYMGRIERTIQRNTKELRELQAERKGLEAKALEEARLLARAAWTEGRTYEPELDELPGARFTFSNDDLADLHDRDVRIAGARQHANEPLSALRKGKKAA